MNSASSGKYHEAKGQAPLVERLDSAIQPINHYSVDKYIQNLLGYPVDNGLCSGYCYPPFEQLEPGDKERADSN